MALAAFLFEGSALSQTPGSNESSLVPNYLYLADQTADAITTYTIDAVTGQLRSTGYANTGITPSGIAARPDGKVIYSTAEFGESVYSFLVNPRSGILGFDGISHLNKNADPFGVVVHPSGKFLYVAQWNLHNVAAFQINVITGDLTMVPGSPFPAGNYDLEMAIDPAGKFLYTGNVSDNTISAFTINQNTGALSAVIGLSLIHISLADFNGIRINRPPGGHGNRGGNSSGGFSIWHM